MWEFIAGYFVGQTLKENCKEKEETPKVDKTEPLKGKDILYIILALIGLILLFII